jgi:hypothetical protein
MVMPADVVAINDMRKIHIYAIGVMILGLSQNWARGFFGEVIAFTIAVFYLFLLRFLAEKIGK